MSAFDPDIRQDIRDSISGEMRAMGVRSALEQRVPALLEPGEQVSFIGVCTPAGRWWREALNGHACVATDRRLLLIDVGYLTADAVPGRAVAGDQTSIYYRDIRGVEPDLGLFESKLDLQLAGATVRLTSMRRKGARAAADAIRRHTAR